MDTKFVLNNNAEHLNAALDLTGSLGFMGDARAVGIYRHDSDGGTGKLAAVVVFECFRGGRAELHFGNTEGHRLTLNTLQGIIMLAFHPKAFNLDRLLARVPVWNSDAIAALVRMGFEMEYRDRASVGHGADAIVLSLDRDALIRKAPAGPQTETSPETSGE